MDSGATLSNSTYHYLNENYSTADSLLALGVLESLRVVDLAGTCCPRVTW